ncbi:hydrogenase accessory protein HypB [Actinopolyspora mortivallis]|uniref:Hydrogenase accessory protein HypB n=1 Tax=Actinopolyspora mortivallis TaxID=33906 RepID=A0A2T0H1J0_ACTMO|nr:hydrogenase accessory protein HypB [Actinopolyspora mortivallis]
MCATCGCGEGETRSGTVHGLVDGDGRAPAEANRGWLTERGVLALNLVGFPGAGRTTLVERTLAENGARAPVAVLVGNPVPEWDAERLTAAGGEVARIDTEEGTPPDAETLGRGLRALDPTRGSVVLVDSVCDPGRPAPPDLGEHARVVLTAATEGDDGPVKYPHLFRGADLVLVNKMDLLPYLSFDPAVFTERLRGVSPEAEILPISVTETLGLAVWYDWLSERVHTPVGEGV